MNIEWAAGSTDCPLILWASARILWNQVMARLNVLDPAMFIQPEMLFMCVLVPLGGCWLKELHAVFTAWGFLFSEEKSKRRRCTPEMCASLQLLIPKPQSRKGQIVCVFGCTVGGLLSLPAAVQAEFQRQRCLSSVTSVYILQVFYQI